MYILSVYFSVFPVSCGEMDLPCTRFGLGRGSEKEKQAAADAYEISVKEEMEGRAYEVRRCFSALAPFSSFLWVEERS